MNENIRKILEALVETNGDRLIEQPECSAYYCRDCNVHSVFGKPIVHAPDCIVTLAKSELQKEASDTTNRKLDTALILQIISDSKKLKRSIDGQKVQAIKAVYSAMPISTRTLKEAKDLVVKHWSDDGR